MLFYQIVEYVRSFVRRESGQDLAEYALVLALVAIAAIAALSALGLNIQNVLNYVANNINTSAGG